MKHLNTQDIALVSGGFGPTAGLLIGGGAWGIVGFAASAWLVPSSGPNLASAIGNGIEAAIVIPTATLASFIIGASVGYALSE